MPGRVISLLGGAERGRGPRGDGVGASGGWFLYASAGGGVCAGATTVCSLCQDFRICGAMPEGGGCSLRQVGLTKGPRGEKKHVPLSYLMLSE